MIQTTPQSISGSGKLSSSTSSRHHSLALKYVLRRFRAVGGTRVLDLGPALGNNVEFLSPFLSKIYIADLYTTLRSSVDRAPLGRSKLTRILEQDLPPPSAAPIDLILAWDLMNYLDREQLRTLGRYLASLCRRDSLVLAMISTLKEIPELPTRFLILDPETLIYENDSSRQRPSPRYREPDIERLMPAFEVETTFLLRHGVQEYVLTTRSLPRADRDKGLRP